MIPITEVLALCWLSGMSISECQRYLNSRFSGDIPMAPIAQVFLAWDQSYTRTEIPEVPQ
jgi:hypothetical protein